MEPDDLEKLFARTDIPAPDPERKKETLNLSVSAFEAQKTAVFKNNQKNSQGKILLARLIRQVTTEKEKDMTGSKKKFVYGGIIGGLATACVALLVYGGGLINPQAELGSIAGKNFSQIVDNVDDTLASAPKAEAPVMKSAMNSLQETAEVAPAISANRAQPAPMAKELGRPAPASALMQMPAEPMMWAAPLSMAVPEQGRDHFTHVEQNSIKQVKQEPVSTFSIDVDTASYAFVRQSLDQGILPQKDAVRVEEMINYFDYAYPAPASKKEPFSTNVVLKPSPWNAGKTLMTIGIKGYDISKVSAPDSNLVFLLDTSGSMNEPKKLPLLKQSLGMLLDTLKPTDKVSIVVYAGAAGTVLQPTPVSEKGVILQALQNLSAGGSTAGGEGIRMAYELAQANFNKDAVNRVILATDGDFNVGITDPEELKGFVEREREKGIFLSVLGFGQGNYNDALMQTLAQNGNGVAAYIDTLNEARKVLMTEASSTLFPIAKDVKIQVEFNPATVGEYRLVGYETRALRTEDFNNDKVDAGDIGAGAEVTAIYEVTPAGAPQMIDQSRYGAKPASAANPGPVDSELAFVKVRYKLPDENESKLLTRPVLPGEVATDPTLLQETGWAEAVAGFAQLLKGGTFTGRLTYDDILQQAQANRGADPFGYRAEFINLVYKAKTAASLPGQAPIPSPYGLPQQ